MVCARVFGNETTIAFAGSQEHFELNVYKPVIAAAFLESSGLLADAGDSFRTHCVEGLQPNLGAVAALMRQSLMLVTALARPRSAMTRPRIAKCALRKGPTLREEALASGLVSACDALVRPASMLALGD